jgi:SAM-dependent methyltransferase
MNYSGKISTGTMLEVHDRYFAPFAMSPFADDMARRLARLSSGPLLETCAGTGILTQAMASATSAGLTIIATDPSSEMLEHATLKSGTARVKWQIADPAALPFPDGTFGIVACHFGVSTLNDRVLAFREARRVLRPGGRFVFSIPGHIRYNPVAHCVQTALDKMFPEDPPEFLGLGLHGYADNETTDDDLTTAGFTDAIYTTVEKPFAAASAWDVAIGYCLGTPLRAEIEARTSGAAEPAIRAAEQALTQRFGSGPIETSMRGHIVSASG